MRTGLDFQLRTWLFALVAATALPAAIALIWMGLSTERAAEREAAEHAQSLATYTAHRADQLIENQRHLLELLAARPSVRALDPDQCDPILGELPALLSLDASIDVVSASGTVVCTSPAPPGSRVELGKRSHAGKAWLREVLGQRRFTIGPPERGLISGRWVAALAVPLQGGASGAVVIALDLLALGARLQPSASMDAHASFFDLDGNMLACSSKDAPALVGHNYRSLRFVAAALERPGQTLVDTGLGGVPRIYGVATAAGGRWRVLVSVDEARVLGPARQRARYALYAGLAALLLVGAGAYWLSGRLARPILALSAMARTAADGTQVARIPEEGPREVREAVLSLNELLAARGEADSALRTSSNRVTQLNRLLRTTWSASRMLAHETDRNSVLAGVCRVLVEAGGLRTAWVGFTDLSGVVRPVAMYGMAKDDLPVVRSDDTPEGNGAVGLAIRTGERQVIRRLEDVKFLPYHEVARRHGHNSWAAFPLRERGQVVGAIAVYAAVADAFSDEDLELIGELARDVGLALQHLDDLEQRRSAEEALKKSEASLIVEGRLASVGRVAAGVAHEINNPLAYVVMNTTVALEELQRVQAAAPPLLRGALGEAIAALREARAGSERVRLIVRDLKVFSRSDAESRGPVDLVRVIESSVSIAWNEIRHRARLVKDLQPVPEVLANESRLGQVFLNLLVNAAQAIEPGAPAQNEVRIFTRREGDRGIVEIRDTGSGISPEMQKRIFEPFFTTKPAGLGTGLGLAICNTIVNALGGELSVESAPGKGSTFRVSLPLAPASMAPPVSARAPAQTLRRARVLVIDDEPSVGNAIRRALLVEHDVVPVAGAKAALELLARGEAFDAVLCDLMMPEMNGMQLYEELSRTFPALAQGMIVMTGGVFTATAQEFLDRLPNQRIEKPFDVQTLRAILRSALR